MALSNVLHMWIGGNAGLPCPRGRVMPTAASLRRPGLPNAARLPLPLLEPYP
jgi:hypothetical protein